MVKLDRKTARRMRRDLKRRLDSTRERLAEIAAIRRIAAVRGHLPAIQQLETEAGSRAAPECRNQP